MSRSTKLIPGRSHLLALIATLCATVLACVEPIRMVDGCTVARQTNTVVADVMVYPNFLKAWEFTPSIAWSDNDATRYTHCTGMLRLHQAFATHADAYAFASEFIVFADSLEIGRDVLKPASCGKVADLGFEPTHYAAVREWREINWTYDSPPRGSLSAAFPDYYDVRPLTCATEPFPEGDVVRTEREVRLHIRMPRLRVRFDLQGVSLEPLQIGFYVDSTDVVHTIRRTYPKSTDPATINETINIETAPGTYAITATFTECSGMVLETHYSIISGTAQQLGRHCHN